MPEDVRLRERGGSDASAGSGEAGEQGGGSDPSQPLVDFMAVIGLNPHEDFATDHHIEPNAMDRSPLRRPYMAYPLCHYPQAPRAWPGGSDAAIDWQAVVMFCFPRGLRFQSREGASPIGISLGCLNRRLTLPVTRSYLAS